MSSEGSLFICHPKEDGEVKLDSGEVVRIQEQTDATIKGITLSDGSQLPTLDWFVETSVAYPETELHIELKAPHNNELFAKYDVAKVVGLT